jgi:cupin superfamily acireductone dioxygenase involved in methionine salvage
LISVEFLQVDDQGMTARFESVCLRSQYLAHVSRLVSHRFAATLSQYFPSVRQFFDTEVRGWRRWLAIGQLLRTH